MAVTALGAGVSLAGGLYAQNRQQKATSEANAATQRQVAKTRKFQARKEKQSIREQRAGIRDANQGFDTAVKHTAGLGAVARRRTLRREKAAVGAGDALLADRGLYDSTRAVNMRRGIRSDTDLTLGSIDESVSQALASIERDRGRTLMAARQNIAGSFERMAGMGSETIMAPTHVAGDQGGFGLAAASVGRMLGLWSAMRQRGDQGASEEYSYGQGPLR